MTLYKLRPYSFLIVSKNKSNYFERIFELSSFSFNHFTLLYIDLHTAFLHRSENKEASNQTTAIISR